MGQKFSEKLQKPMEKDKKIPALSNKSAGILGAASRNRTGTVFLPADFKSAMSTDFIMAANHKIAPILALIAVRVKWAEKTCAARVGIPARAAQMPSIAPLAQDSVHQRFVLYGTL